MGLGRNEKLHISCDYKGREDDCPKECSRCAISIKTDGDVALSVNQLDDAIRQYKRALFLEPAFAEAWCNLASAYGMKSEYRNALLAFDKALAVDSQYGKAMYGKAVTLRNLGMLDEAFTMTVQILEVYRSSEAERLKTELIAAGAKASCPAIDREDLKEDLRQYYEEYLWDNSFLLEDGKEPFISEIYQPEQFTEAVLAYCKKKYASFGDFKVRSECIITSFYGAICATVFYYRDKEGITATSNFDYLNEHIDIEFTDVNAERLLGTKSGEKKAEKIWSLLTPYLEYAHDVFRLESELSDELIIEAMKGAYKLGMLVAVDDFNEEKKIHRKIMSDRIMDALQKIHDEKKNDDPPPPESAMCYSPRY